jgi:predicted secreted protein
MGRRLPGLACLVALLLPGPALAADAAQSEIIGYAPGNRYFAFEQWGIQDGSGFPYADIFILDLKANAWLPGTPIRVLTEDEKQTAGSARRKAAAAAAPLLQKLAIGEPAVVLASTPATELVEDRQSLTFDLYYHSIGPSVPLPPADLYDDSRFRLKLAMKDMPPAAPCTEADGPFKGFTLSLDSLKTGASRLVHSDDSLPKSRGCPLNYDIDKIVGPSQTFGVPNTLVAIVGVYTFGFEGQDRRFIAVPIEMSE